MIRRCIITILCLASVGCGWLWVESYAREWPDGLGRPQAGRLIFFGENDMYSFSQGIAQAVISCESTLISKLPNTMRYSPNRSFFYGKSALPGPAQAERLCIAVPFWFPFLLLAAYPTIAFIRAHIRRKHRCKHGRCIKCGYDLTGNESGACPECGVEVPSVKPARQTP